MKNCLHKLLLAFSCWLLAAGAISAQSIDSLEYFFDADPGPGNGNVYGVSVSDSITDTVSFGFPGLTPGFHTLSFRVRDTNGTWSLYETRTFFLNDTIIPESASFDSSSAEYFFDSDPGVGNGAPLQLTPGDSLLDSTLALTAGLLPGFHTLYVRCKDTNNTWSLYEGGKIFLYDTLMVSALPPSPPLAETEYFIDTDPGIDSASATNSFAVADSIQFSDTLATGTLTAGTHYLYVRVRDTLNIWSLCERAQFVVCNLIPVPDFSADTVCLGKPTPFTDLSTNQDTAYNYTYSWDFNNDGTTDDTTRGNTTHVFGAQGTHTVTLVVNNTNGCVDTITKTVYVDSLPSATFVLPTDTICSDDTLNLAGGNPPGGVYSGNGVNTGVFYGPLVGAGQHIIYYTYYNSDSCSVTVYDFVYSSSCLGVAGHDGTDMSVIVSPNPMKNSSTISLQAAGAGVAGSQFVLYDVFGKELMRRPFTHPVLLFNRGQLSSGFYLFSIFDLQGRSTSGKLLIVD